jgi:hypothetical protein
VSTDKPMDDFSRRTFRLGLFGDTRSGKTVYLTALKWLAEEGRLPAGVNGLRPADPESARYLGRRVAQMRSGNWPEGTIDTACVSFILDTSGKSVAIKTRDFRGGDFGSAWYEGDRDDTERFVSEIFEGTSAAMFLLDPADPKNLFSSDATLEENSAAERRVTAVETALEILRKQSRGFQLFHRPVAVVFTKCDEHADVMADPEGFARKHVRQQYDYLRRHAGKRYRYFAISSTGALTNPMGKPPRTLRPDGVLAPVLWCHQQHRNRERILFGTVVVLLLFATAILYGVLFASNESTFSEMRASLPTANAEAKAQLYQRAKEMAVSTRYMLTHPRERRELCVEILQATEDALRETLLPRMTDAGNLRTVDDYLAATQRIAEFEQRYPGTESTKRQIYWLDEQRDMLAKRLSESASEAAEDGNDSKFNKLIEQYIAVATTEYDPVIDRARRVLTERKAQEAARILARRRQAASNDIPRILEACSNAEQNLRSFNAPHECNARQYIELIRETYEELYQHGTVSKFKLERVEGSRRDKVKWTVTVVGADSESTVESPGWEEPVRFIEDGWYRVLGGEFKIDIFETREIRFDVHENTNFSDGTASVERSPEILARECERGIGYLDCITDEGHSFKLALSASDCRACNYFSRKSKIEELEDVILRKRVP